MNGTKDKKSKFVQKIIRTYGPGSRERSDVSSRERISATHSRRPIHRLFHLRDLTRSCKPAISSTDSKSPNPGFTIPAVVWGKVVYRVHIRFGSDHVWANLNLFFSFYAHGLRLLLTHDLVIAPPCII